LCLIRRLLVLIGIGGGCRVLASELVICSSGFLRICWSRLRNRRLIGGQGGGMASAVLVLHTGIRGHVVFVVYACRKVLKLLVVALGDCCAW